MTDQPHRPAAASHASAAPEPPKKIKMEAIKDGSIHGFPFEVGDALDVDEIDVETLQRGGFALRADRAEIAQQERDAAKKAAETRAATERKNPVVGKR